MKIRSDVIQFPEENKKGMKAKIPLRRPIERAVSPKVWHVIDWNSPSGPQFIKKQEMKEKKNRRKRCQVSSSWRGINPASNQRPVAPKEFDVLLEVLSSFFMFQEFSAWHSFLYWDVIIFWKMPSEWFSCPRNEFLVGKQQSQIERWQVKKWETTRMEWKVIRNSASFKGQETTLCRTIILNLWCLTERLWL